MTARRSRISRRQCLQLASVTAVGGFAGCALDDGTGAPAFDSNNESDQNADVEGIDAPAEPASFAYDIEGRERENDGWSDSWTVTGYVSAEGNHYERDDDGEELYGYEGMIYQVNERGACIATEDDLGAPVHFSRYFSVYRPSPFELADREPVETTEIDDLTVEVYEFETPRFDYMRGEQWLSYIAVDTNYWVGADISVYQQDDVVSETAFRRHSFDEELTVTLPDECQ